MLSLWCGYCSRRKGPQTQSGWRGCQLYPHSPLPQCTPLTAADRSGHLLLAYNLQYTYTQKAKIMKTGQQTTEDRRVIVCRSKIILFTTLLVKRLASSFVFAAFSKNSTITQA